MKKLVSKKIVSFLPLLLIVFYLLTHLGDSNTKKSTFHSNSLQKDMKVNVYLPAGYSTSKQYPVLYLFHGKDGNEDSFMNGFFGINGVNIDKKADELMKENKMNPLLIVAPEIDNSYGFNSSLTHISQKMAMITECMKIIC